MTVRLLTGDCREVLPTLPAESAHCCVTSPLDGWRVGPGQRVDRVIASADAIECAAFNPQPLPPRHKPFGTTAPTAVFARLGMGCVGRDQTFRHAWVASLPPGECQKAAVSYGLADHSRASITKLGSDLLKGEHGQVSPARIFESPPIGKLSERLAFALSQVKQQFGLASFDAKERKKLFGAECGHLISRLPSPNGARVFAARAILAKASAKGATKQCRHIRRDLLEAASLAVHGLSGVATHPHRVGVALDAKKTVAVHCAGKIGQNHIIHRRYIPSCGGDVIIACPQQGRKGVTELGRQNAHRGRARNVEVSRKRDCALLRNVPAVTYWGLRSYLPDGHEDKHREIGLESTPEAYVAELVAVFREVRRVLRPDGTLWLNLGDSYAGSWGNQGRKEERGTQRPINGAMLSQVHDGRYPSNGSNTGKIPAGSGLKPKDLVGIPWLVAFALRADGWYLRSDIIWAKPNPMPESVRDRPTKSHEYLFLLSKSERYFYDATAIAEPASETNGAQAWRRVFDPAKQTKEAVLKESGIKSGNDGAVATRYGETRNARSVWTIATQPYAESHFAVMPPELAERCIKAGTSEKGCCPHCGAPWIRQTEAERRPGSSPTRNDHASRRSSGNGSRNDAEDGRSHSVVITIGWQPSCACSEHNHAPCTVLDPFSGAGTAGLVADRLQRHAVLIDLNPAYGMMAEERVRQDAGLFAELVP